MRKINDIVIYRDERFYAAFPSIVRRHDGELLVAFAERRIAGSSAPEWDHVDPNSYLVMVRSSDDGQTWSTEPEHIFAHPFGGSQDTCIIELDDRSLLLSSYAWMLLPEPKDSKVQSMNESAGWHFTFIGGYLMRSTDGGRHWQGPIVPPVPPGEVERFPGVPLPAYNRGAMAQGRDGTIYWAVARSKADDFQHTWIDLLTSRDRGLTWQQGGIIASDAKVAFNETSLYQTVAGDLVGFVRTGTPEAVIVRSSDQGRTWAWKELGLAGHPLHATRLPDGHVLLVYGHRLAPFGIRARVMDLECTDWVGEELVLRDDGGNRDLGYPWACTVSDRRALVVYYFNKADGTRSIEGTWLEL